MSREGPCGGRVARLRAAGYRGTSWGENIGCWDLASAYKSVLASHRAFQADLVEKRAQTGVVVRITLEHGDFDAVVTDFLKLLENGQQAFADLAASALGGDGLGQTRAGWLDIGGYFQYTVIRDVPNQFLATVGLGWTGPSGSSAVFEGAPQGAGRLPAAPPARDREGAA